MTPATTDPWAAAPGRLRARGLRWTPQRRALVAVLARSSGHLTAAEILERCRAEDPDTTPSTVYRTLDVLEELGLVRHAHGPDGREDYHVLPDAEHGHLHCGGCGTTIEIDAANGRDLVRSIERRHDFAVDLSHLTVSGLCADCRESAPA